MVYPVAYCKSLRMLIGFTAGTLSPARRRLFIGWLPLRHSHSRRILRLPRFLGSACDFVCANDDLPEEAPTQDCLGATSHCAAVDHPWVLRDQRELVATVGAAVR
ncbi:uncharacterized protein L969DRAFT_96566 [Mixia osmundae IAM 14324]|uniref:Uncharacterized protein n=1 Tax=Mixia osmundae (strain CBS 9802 / IAM 14324 / JCM 22182 / KY 12970) TaxID=764103 RepID=G7EAT9_MIXOS|nr:uncharacterized protein L969DRAFT_96566 [Mixia osmundae IAM 14324]KEI36983.1 hypothetical protein L969DRAFT_96566 [Mixia osmundae IAM 14324]GAA99949.1 hypothetical protein E5Q_06652 [Mixia osmundae IAM 14324]